MKRVVSAVIQTSLGGIQVSVCACGVLCLYGFGLDEHYDTCPVNLEAARVSLALKGEPGLQGGGGSG